MYMYLLKVVIMPSTLKKFEGHDIVFGSFLWGTSQFLVKEYAQ